MKQWATGTIATVMLLMILAKINTLDLRFSISDRPIEVSVNFEPSNSMSEVPSLAAEPPVSPPPKPRPIPPAPKPIKAAAESLPSTEPIPPDPNLTAVPEKSETVAASTPIEAAMSEAILLFGDMPAYPKGAWAHDIETIIQVKLTVNQAGRVMNIELIEGNDDWGFYTAIKTAVATWKFEPVRVNGVPQAFYFIKPFEFMLVD